MAADTQQSTADFAAKSVDYLIALGVGLFFGFAFWLWAGMADSVAANTLLSGLPICF